ncbi:hypothetical protein [uncultured Selenomonas sp.]|uniref:hypothetical protein n=1 Tax=uncultured Selenomonas sp. TaxID=159275 RepID=UPI00260AA342|nr:hypothetical protein [uncultured Selenomonas sp.]
MTLEEFVAYVDALPSDCVDKRTAEEVIFHLPKKKHTCPACGSQHTCVNKYRDQALKGITNTKLRYIYHARRYRCSDCGKTFAEENPFIGRTQRKLGSPLKSLRGNKKISIAKMARLLGVPQYIYQDMEKLDPLLPPSMEIAEKTARILSVSIEEIWGDRQKLAEGIQRAAEEKELKKREKEQERHANSLYQDEWKGLKDSISDLSLEERSRLIEWWKRDVRNAALENGDKE